MRLRSLSRTVVLGCLVLGPLAVGRLAAQQPAATARDVADPLKIVVNSVTGSVQYQRDDKWQRLTTESVLKQGDTVVSNVGGICKLVFQHPKSEEVLSAAILRGYTQMTVAEAYQQGDSSRTQLDVTQGIIRAGVVRTATPPSYQVRTPRVVVGVRGTEIAELEASSDMGDHLLMGRIGIAMTHDAVPRSRSTRAGQATLKRVEGDRRGDALLRAIEEANLDHRVVLTGRHRHGLEIDIDRHSFDLLEFPGDFPKSEGNPGWDRTINSTKTGGKCPFCLTGGNGKPRGSGGGKN